MKRVELKEFNWYSLNRKDSADLMLSVKFKIKLEDYQKLLNSKNLDKAIGNEALSTSVINAMIERRSTISTEETEGTREVESKLIETELDGNKLSKENNDIARIYHHYKNYSLPDTITIDKILELHSDIFKKTLLRKELGIRKMELKIGGTSKYFIKPRDVEYFLADVVYFMNNKSTDDSAEIMKNAAFIHGNLIGIHPFRDGNGRTTRLLVDKYISKNLGTKLYISEAITNLKISRYHKELDKFHYEQDITSFENYMFEVAIEQIEINTKRYNDLFNESIRIRSKLEETNIKEKYFASLIYLILEAKYIHRKLLLKRITNELDVTLPTSRKILDELIKNKIVSKKKNKEGRTIVYEVII